MVVGELVVVSLTAVVEGPPGAITVIPASVVVTAVVVASAAAVPGIVSP